MDYRNKLLNILFYNTGSTTSILEAITGRQVKVEILEEKVYQNHELSEKFHWNKDIVLRITNLESDHRAVSHNVVLYDPEYLKVFNVNFSYLNFPIGKILEQIDSRRIISKTSWKNTVDLNTYFQFSRILSKEKYPVKEYYYLHDSKILFYIFEIYEIENLNDMFQK